MNYERVLERVSQAFGVQATSMKLNERGANIKRSRFAAVFLMRSKYFATFETIAVTLNYADHSSAIWAYRRAVQLLGKDPQFLSTMQSITDFQLGMVPNDAA